MDDRGRPHRGPGRFLAPLALAATIAGVFLIVSGNSGSGSGGAGGGSTSSQHGRSGSAKHPSSGQTGKHQAAHGHSGGHAGHGGSPAGASAGGSAGGTTGGTTTAPTTSTASTTGTSTTATTGPGAKFYVVQPGDTMEVISVKTHVPLATIEALNPSVSSNAMSVGQRIRIRK